LAGNTVSSDDQVAMIDAAMRSADSGQFISHEAMSEWLRSWGSGEEKPAPEVDIIKPGHRGGS